MDKRQKAVRRNKEEWIHILKRCLESGIPMRQFAQQNKIAYHSLVAWKHKIKKSNLNKEGSLCEIKPSSSPAKVSLQTIVIALPNHVSIRVEGAFTETTRHELAMLIQELCA